MLINLFRVCYKCTRLQWHPVVCDLGTVNYNLLSTSSISTRIVGKTNWPGMVGAIIALPAALRPSRVSMKSSAVSSATPSIRTKVVSSNELGPIISNNVA